MKGVTFNINSLSIDITILTADITDVTCLRND